MVEIRVGVRFINSEDGGGPDGNDKLSGLTGGIRFEEARRDIALTSSRELRKILRDFSFDIDFGNLICGKGGKGGILAEMAKRNIFID